MSIIHDARCRPVIELDRVVPNRKGGGTSESREGTRLISTGEGMPERSVDVLIRECTTVQIIAALSAATEIQTEEMCPIRNSCPFPALNWFTNSARCGGPQPPHAECG